MFRFALLIGLLGASGLASAAQLRVFACEPEWAALVTELAGGKVQVTAATTAGQDPHHIQARPSLIARLRRADLLVCTGAGLEEGWLPLLLRRARNPRVQPGRPGYLMATDSVTLLERPASLDRARGHMHAAGNPHIQTDPRRVRLVGKALAARLAQLDPANAAGYRQRYAAFDEAWQNKMAAWQRAAAGLRGKSVIVHHQEWVYLLDWLGLRRLAALEPKPGVPPSPAHLASLKQRVAGSKALLGILRSPRNDARPARWLAKQAKLRVIELPTTVGAVPGTERLQGLFDVIIQRLVAAAR